MQLTRIERCKARLDCIKQKVYGPDVRIDTEQVAKTTEAHHHIGQSENHFEHIGTFLRSHSHDPAVKVF